MLNSGRGDCTVNLDYWFSQQMEKLENFRDWWRECHKNDGLNWPMVLRPGDWDEQFDFYCDERNN